MLLFSLNQITKATIQPHIDVVFKMLHPKKIPNDIFYRSEYCSHITNPVYLPENYCSTYGRLYATIYRKQNQEGDTG